LILDTISTINEPPAAAAAAVASVEKTLNISGRPQLEHFY